MRLLLAEDDQTLGHSLQQALRQEGHAANWVPDARSARSALEAEHYDLIIVDLALPEGSGLELISFIRKVKHADNLVLALGDRLDKGARINALDAGADDYLLKPFGLDELRANIRALIRRQAGRPASTLSHGAISLDPTSRQVTLHGNAVDLTPREFAILEILLENAGRIVSKSRLEETLYAWDAEVESNAVEVHVHRLRKKLGADSIRTVRGVGYAINQQQPEVATAVETPAADDSISRAIAVAPSSVEALLSTLDQIFRRLRHDLDHERSVCTDTAQILRRPLNAIKLQAELALRTDDPSARSLTLKNILAAADRAQTLLDSLATVMGLDRETSPELTKRVNLCDICETVISELEAGAREREIGLSLIAPCRGTIWGDANLLRVMVRQLLESILNKTSARRDIEVAVVPYGTQHVRLVVRGASGHEEHTANLMRTSEAESTENALTTTHRGWQQTKRPGITLIERIVELHNGTLFVSRLPTDQPHVEIQFPACSEDETTHQLPSPRVAARRNLHSA